MEIVPDGWCCLYFGAKRCRGVCVRALGMEMCQYHWCVELALPENSPLEEVLAALEARGGMLPDPEDSP